MTPPPQPDAVPPGIPKAQAFQSIIMENIEPAQQQNHQQRKQGCRQYR